MSLDASKPQPSRRVAPLYALLACTLVASLLVPSLVDAQGISAGCCPPYVNGLPVPNPPAATVPPVSTPNPTAPPTIPPNPIPSPSYYINYLMGQKLPTVGACVPNTQCTPGNSFQGGGSLNAFANFCPKTAAAPQDAFLGAGTLNYVGGDQAGLVAGKSNLITCDAPRAFLGAGQGNKIDTPEGAILAGRSNLVARGADDSVIGAGLGNTVVGPASVILAGTNNNVTGSSAAIAAGAVNVNAMDFGFIGGGNGNKLLGVPKGADMFGCGDLAPSVDTLVLGPTASVAVPCSGFIGAGTGNIVERAAGAIGAGNANHIYGSGDNGFIGGGENNKVMGLNGAVLGGQKNVAYGTNSGVATGNSNNATGIAAFVGAGQNNKAAGDYSVILAGANNNARATSSVIGGGQINTIGTLALGAMIGAGQGNTVTGQYAVIGAGVQNQAVGRAAAVVAGANNLALGDASLVGAGRLNIASGNAAVVGAGENNTAGGSYSVVGGGYRNLAVGQYSAIGGGYQNRAVGEGTTIGGGVRNEARADYSTVPGGLEALADVYGQQAFASGGFPPASNLAAAAIPGTAQTSKFVLRQTVKADENGAEKEMFTDGAAQRIVIRPGTTWTFRIFCVATDQAGNSKAWEWQGVIARRTASANNPGQTNIIGNTVSNVLGADSATDAWGCDVVNPPENSALTVKVHADGDVRFVASVQTVEVSF